MGHGRILRCARHSGDCRSDFLPSDDTQRLNGVVLSEAFWRARFNADPGVVGSTIRLDGDPWTVLGVVRQEAQLLQTSIWALVAIQGAPAAARGQYFLQAIGRLKPGVSLEAARADMAAVSEGLAQAFPSTNTGAWCDARAAARCADRHRASPDGRLFLGVVGIVLLICCANVANLLLVRATVRKRELAIRSALGADRRRVVRQLLTESLVLSVIGGMFGLMVAAAILNVAHR